MNRKLVEEACASHRSKLVATATRIMRSREDGEDIVQWAMLKALSSPFDGRCKFTTWLHTVVVMKCLEVQRSRYRGADRAALSPEPETITRIDSAIEARDRLRSVFQQIDALPESQRKALVESVTNPGPCNDKDALFHARLKLVA